MRRHLVGMAVVCVLPPRKSRSISRFMVVGFRIACEEPVALTAPALDCEDEPRNPHGDCGGALAAELAEVTQGVDRREEKYRHPAATAAGGADTPTVVDSRSDRGSGLGFTSCLCTLCRPMTEQIAVTVGSAARPERLGKWLR
jgi:hypothetical protein